VIALSTALKGPAIGVMNWNDMASDSFVPIDVAAINARVFKTMVNVVALGPLTLANVIADPEIVEHPAGHAARQADRKFLLHLQLQGRMGVCQDGRQVWLDHGDIVVCDSALPYRLEHRERCSFLVLTIPYDRLKQHLPNPDQIGGWKFCGNQGFSQTISLMLKSLWAQAADGFDAEIGNRLAAHLLDMLTTTWMSTTGVSVEDSAAGASRRIQICRYIEANLRDPELTTRSVAAAFRISTRYLHMVFSARGETVSGFILRRRLEQCAKQFADPLWNKRTITEIAFGWGFNNATHFARVFRNHYRLSPRDYRNRGRSVLEFSLNKAVA
jgi:AraC family transcriptional activator of tynA and feaB